MKNFIFDIAIDMNSSKEKVLLKNANPLSLFLRKILCSSVTCKYWFRRFKGNNFDVSDRLRFRTSWKFWNVWGRFGNIIEWKHKPNTNRTCRIAWSWPSNNFKVTVWNGKNSKARKMSAAKVIAKHHYPSIECYCFLGSTRKIFCRKLLLAMKNGLWYPKRRHSWMNFGKSTTSMTIPNIHSKKILL